MNEQKPERRKKRKEENRGREDRCREGGNFSWDTNSFCIKQAGTEETTVVKAHEGYPAPLVSFTYPLEPTVLS